MNQERDIQSSPGILSLQGEEHVNSSLASSNSAVQGGEEKALLWASSNSRFFCMGYKTLGTLSVSP